MRRPRIFTAVSSSESCGLSGGDLEIAGYAALLAFDGEFKVLLSRDDCFVVNLSLMLEMRKAARLSSTC
jgi:hypothetical protein